MILLIGWRGEPDVKDEPQHLKQGRVTESILDAMELPYQVLSKNEKEAKSQILKICRDAKDNSKPYALLIKKNTFSEKLDKVSDKIIEYSLNREKVIQKLVLESPRNSSIVSTTGHISRELYETRRNSKTNNIDFLTVGSMGHALKIALGVSLFKKENLKVICLDGDGSIIMHLGSLAVTAKYAPSNFVHIVINNGSHESVGGQPTVGFDIDMAGIAMKCGYKKVYGPICDDKELSSTLKIVSKEDFKGPCFIEIRVKKGHRSNLLRPHESPVQNKEKFIEFISRI